MNEKIFFVKMEMDYIKFILIFIKYLKIFLADIPAEYLEEFHLGNS